MRTRLGYSKVLRVSFTSFWLTLVVIKTYYLFEKYTTSRAERTSCICAFLKEKTPVLIGVSKTVEMVR